MELIKTESVFNLDALTEGKAYRVTLISDDKGVSRDGLLDYAQKESLKFCFLSASVRGECRYATITPSDVEKGRYKIEPLIVGADQSKCPDFCALKNLY